MDKNMAKRKKRGKQRPDGWWRLEPARSLLLSDLSTREVAQRLDMGTIQSRQGALWLIREIRPGITSAEIRQMGRERVARAWEARKKRGPGRPPELRLTVGPLRHQTQRLLAILDKVDAFSPTPTIMRILLVVGDFPGIIDSDVQRQVGFGITVVFRHLNRLKALGLARYVGGAGVGRQWRLTPEGERLITGMREIVR